MKKNSIVVAGFAATLVASTPAWGFTFDDIHFWVGEGTNRCAVALDFGEESLAWGYKWNGTCTNLFEVVNRIVDQDHRLVMGFQRMTASYYDLYFFGYDKDDGAASWDKNTGSTSSANALWGLEDRVSFSQWWVLYGPMTGPSFPTTPQYSSWLAANSIVPVDGNWFVFAIGSTVVDENWNESPAVLDTPTAAESPYGWRVFDSNVSTGDDKYDDVENVLGRPTAYMYGQWGGPVSPYNPAWKEDELLTLEGEDDYVIIEFDHDVVDDPDNPFGLDFIVFGNSFGVGQTDEYYTPDMGPNGISFSGSGTPEPGLVEVSQDGRTWYSFKDGPFCDDFAPTLGFCYDDANPDTTLYSGNRWWGKMTDACYPVDPSLSWASLQGLTLAEVAKRYNGSAGGTGYDIDKLPLPLNAQGRKWFRYVRISGMESDTPNEAGDYITMPEVDAVADVAPVSGYKKWVLDNYSWDKAWQTNLTGFAAIAANGLANGLNYMYGLAPTDAVTVNVPFKVVSFEPGETEHVIKMLSPKQMTVAPKGLVVKETASLGSGWKSVAPTLVSSESQGDGTWLNTFTVPKGEGAFFKLALDE